MVYLQAGPGISGCVALLGSGQFLGFPVAQLLALRDFLPEEDGINLLQAQLFDAEELDFFLQLHNAAWLKRGPSVKHHEVVVQRKPYLGDGGVLEQVDDRQRQIR